MKCTVLAVGRLRPPYADDVQHYRGLLIRHTKLDLIEVREDEQLERRIPERCFLVELHSEGQQFDSIAFSRWLEQRRQGGLDIVFTIGGPYGTPLKRTPDLRLSLGPMTLPHQLARVVLVEQLYRGHRILAGEPYHH